MFSLKLDEFVDTRSFDKLAELYENGLKDKEKATGSL